MSTVNVGGKNITGNLVFALDGDLSVSYVKTPRQLSGCILWLDASDTSTLTTEGAGYVRYWSDKSNSGVVATGGGLTLANEPLLVSNSLNGLPTIYFDGADYFEIPNNSALQTQNEKTIFVVYKYKKVSNTNYGVLIQRGSGDSSEEMRLAVVNNADWIYFDIGNNGGPYIQPTVQNINIRDYAANIITATATRSAGSSTLKLYSNGKDMGGSTINPANTPSIGSFITSIGKQIEGASNTNFFTGFISEIIIYNRCLSDTERKQVEQYLGYKWAIPLSLTTSVTSIRDLSNLNTLNAIYPTTYPILQHPYKDVIEQNAYGDYFTFNSSTSIQNIGTGPFTIEWCGAIIGRVNGGTNYVIFDNGEVYQTRGVVLRFDGSLKRLYLRFSHGGTPTNTSFYDTPVLTTGRYYHYLISYDGSNVKFYLDGVLTNNVAFTTRAAASTLSNFYPIGSTQCLQGETLYLKIYNKSFTAAEATYQYELEKNRIASMPQIITDNLQIWLDSNYHSSYPNSGTSFFDLTNNQNYFQLTNSPTFAITEPRTFNLSGASQYFLYYTSIGAPTGNTGLALPSTNSWTCSFWFKTSTTDSNRNPLLSHMGSGPVYCLMGFSNSVLIYYHYDGNNGGWLTKTATTNIADNNWHNVVYVNTNNTMTIYLDGVLEKSSFSSTTTNANNYVNGLGGSWESRFLTGSLSTFMYYNTNLSAAQILQNYNAQKYRFGK